MMININGKIYNGNCISINNGRVIIDGKEQINGLSGTVKVIVEGNLKSLKADGSVEVNGDVKGNIYCGGSCNCNNVGGDVDCGGSCNCGNVAGDVDAGGGIKMKR